MRFLRSPLLLFLFLSSVACTWNETDEDGCRGCTSGHSYSGSPATPASVSVTATVSKLVLASGVDYANGKDIQVVWSGDVFTLLATPSSETDAGDASDGGHADGGVDADASVDDASVSDAGDADADADASDVGDAAVAMDPRAFGRIHPVHGTLDDGPTSPTSYDRTLLLEVVLCDPGQRLVPGDRCVGAAGREVDADVFQVEGRAAGDETTGRTVTVRDERLDLDANEHHWAAQPATPDGVECL